MSVIKFLQGLFQRKMVVLLVAIVLLFAVLFNSGMFGGKDTRVRISCVGDSLTYGSGVLKTREINSYPAQLQSKLGTGYLVSNYGLRNACASDEGDLPYSTSAEYADSLKSQPDIVILMLGTNDAKSFNWNQEQYKSGLIELVRSYQNLDGSPRVVLMRSPYCYSEDGSDIASYDIQVSVVKDYLGAVVNQVAEETGTSVIDLYEVTEGQEDLYTDGIHFNQAGYRLIAHEVYDAIKDIEKDE